MKRALLWTVTLILTLSVLTGCRDLFTTSLFTAFGRDGLGLSAATPISDLLRIARDPEGGRSDPVIAAEILDALAGKPAIELTTLPIDDKETILQLAITAGLDLPAIGDALTDLMNSDDRSASFTAMIEAIDPGINTASILVLLNDSDTLANADALTLTMATLVIVADLASTVDPVELQQLIIEDPGAGYGTVTNPVIQQQIEIIREALEALDSRPQEEKDKIEFFGVNIFDLLTGA